MSRKAFDGEKMLNDALLTKAEYVVRNQHENKDTQGHVRGELMIVTFQELEAARIGGTLDAFIKDAHAKLISLRSDADEQEKYFKSKNLFWEAFINKVRAMTGGSLTNVAILTAMIEENTKMVEVEYEAKVFNSFMYTLSNPDKPYFIGIIYFHP